MSKSISLVAAMLLAAGPVFAQDAAKSVGVEPHKAPSGASVFIVSPKDGETTGQEFTVKFGAKGIAIRPAGDPTPGTGHHHLLIDVAELPPAGAPIPNDATHKHYGKGQTEATITLPPGDHTLQLEFADLAHVPFDSPIVSKKITVHVK
ncbi:MAG: DUF4399 domain-containing protein [Rudaea sp.]|uniref:DUF4399 domain-containing protein n=1 Tax=Rudaea sp. TaxID=2136325 RepID=UPI0039E58C93